MNIFKSLYGYIKCFDLPSSEEETTNIESLKIPLLSSKHTQDDHTVVCSKAKGTIVQIVSLILKKRNIIIDNIYIKDDNLIISPEGKDPLSFHIENIRVDDVIRFSCKINFEKFIS